MRIIGEHIRSPHEDLARKRRSVYNRVNVSRQRKYSSIIVAWRADVERKTSVLFVSLALDGDDARG
jgi:hypothetical protein